MNQNIDMSEFEKQFMEGRLSPFMPNEDFSRLAFLNDRIRSIEEVSELRKDEIQSLTWRQEAIQKVIRRIEVLLDKYRKKRQPLDDEINRLKRINRGEDAKREAYERERQRLIQELMAQRNFLEQKNFLKESTANLPWAVGVDGKKALPHQLEGAARLVAAERAILGDKPGLGKTLQAIMVVDMLRAQGGNKGRKVLIFTPKQVLADFQRAFEKWTDPKFVHVLNQTSVKGIKSELLDMLMHFPEMIVITNYEVWRKDQSIHDKLKKCAFDTIICDEAHVLKNIKSTTARKVRDLVYAENLCSNCGGRDIHSVKSEVTDKTLSVTCMSCETRPFDFSDFCSVKNFYPMTGTPILNKPQELWPLLNMMDRKSFPTEKSFLEDYCEKKYDYDNERWYYTFGAGGSERLLKKLGMRYTARTRESAGVIMPPQEVKHHWLEFDPDEHQRQQKFIENLRLKAKMVFAPDQEVTTDQALHWYTRMRQAAVWPDGIQVKGCAHEPMCKDEWDLPNPKACISPSIVFPAPGTPPVGESILMDKAEEIVVEAVEAEQRIVVFTHFRAAIEELERRCIGAGLRVGKIVGGVKEELRREYIDDFNTEYTKVGEHKYDVLICQYQTAQVGLNLNGAHQLLCIDREWNPGKEEQTLDRVRRLDSELSTIVHILHCAGTATELIDALNEQKKAMLEGWEADVSLLEAMRKFLEG